MSCEAVKCMHCGANVVPAERFCESCGSILRAIRRAALPGPTTSLEAPCADCGNETYVDDYCAACGNRRAEPSRDQVDLDGIVLITDRGLEHPRNEDAAAAGIVAGEAGEPPHAMAVAVCDGVSTSADAQAAAVSASMAGVDAMLRALAASRDARSAVLAGLTDAAIAAASAGLGSLDPTMAPSCTYAAAVIVPSSGGTAEITVGNVGDSRVYWLPGPACSGAMPDSRRFPCAGTDHRRRPRRFRSRAGRRAHPDPVARRRRRADAVDGVECAHDHRRAGLSRDVHRRVVELPTRSRRHRATLQRERRDGVGPRTRRLCTARGRSGQHHRRGDPDRRHS